jgi:hypothetical protein
MSYQWLLLFFGVVGFVCLALGTLSRRREPRQPEDQP